MGDASRILHELAIWCVETMKLPDPCVGVVLDTKRRWLAGEIGNNELFMFRDRGWVDYLRWIACPDPTLSAKNVICALTTSRQHFLWEMANVRLETAVRESLGLEPMVRSTSA